MLSGNRCSTLYVTSACACEWIAGPLMGGLMGLRGRCSWSVDGDFRARYVLGLQVSIMGILPTVSRSSKLDGRDMLEAGFRGDSVSPRAWSGLRFCNLNG